MAAGQPEQTRSVSSLRPAVLWTALSLLAFLLVEAAVFRSGWYFRYLEPNSSAGQLELRLFWLNHNPRSRRPEVMVLGDSRMAEGFSAREARAAAGNRVRFWNMGVGGTSPRVWYYFIRDADPSRKRFAAIVLPVDRYYDDLNKREVDLHYAVGRLSFSDCVDFTRSMDLPGHKLEIFTGCILKGITVRQDVKAFFAHMPNRLHAAEDWRENGAAYVDGYQGKTEDVTGISMDRTDGRLQFPARLNQLQRFTIEETVMPPPEREPAQMTRYQEFWIGRILDLYKSSRTRIIFVEIPQRPLPLESPGEARPAFAETIRGRANVRVIPAVTFRDLEKPELFADGLHLNHAGRPLFSERLGLEVDNILDGR